MVAGISDGIDGFPARHLNQKTVLGAILDPIADKALLVSIFVMLGFKDHLPLWLVVLVVFR
ncbi:CDP-alcohol phosphatidyltransferase family protein, partial [Escherichia coli]